MEYSESVTQKPFFSTPYWLHFQLKFPSSQHLFEPLFRERTSFHLEKNDTFPLEDQYASFAIKEKREGRRGERYVVKYPVRTRTYVELGRVWRIIRAPVTPRVSFWRARHVRLQSCLSPPLRLAKPFAVRSFLRTPFRSVSLILFLSLTHLHSFKTRMSSCSVLINICNLIPYN